MKNIWKELRVPFSVLAPMDDVTDTVFRQLISLWSPPDLFFTEFASADGLQSKGRHAVLRKLQKSDSEGPLIAQIWGLQPDAYEKTATEIVEMGFDGLDINMGCPVKKVINNGACSALAENRPLAKELINAARKGLDGKIPLSVKCRIGYKVVDLTWIEFLLEQKLDALTIHGRTTKEQSKVPMHWEVFPEIKKIRDRIAPDTVLIANGDIMSTSEGILMSQKYGLNGYMIGRGVFHDPFVFAKQSPWHQKTKDERLAMYGEQINLFIETWPDANPNMLKKFCKVYIHGFEGAGEMRSEIMQTQTPQQMLNVLMG